MSYKPYFMGNALVQLRGLPSDAFDALVVQVAHLVNAPWDADLADRKGDTNERHAVFGEGLGLLSFRVDDLAELIVIFDIAWIG